MSFYDKLDQLDQISKDLRDLADQVAVGAYSVGVPPEPEEPAPSKDAKK